MTTSARTAPFAHYLGIGKPNAAKPARSKSSPSKGPKAPATSGRKRAKRPAQDTPSSFAHLVPAVAQKSKAMPPAQRAAIRGSAARAAVAAYAKVTGQVPATRQDPKPGSAAEQALSVYRRVLPGGPQTSPNMSPTAERDLAARIIAAGQRRRGES